jgi:hypothetical protein
MSPSLGEWTAYGVPEASKLAFRAGLRLDGEASKLVVQAGLRPDSGWPGGQFYRALQASWEHRSGGVYPDPGYDRRPGAKNGQAVRGRYKIYNLRSGSVARFWTKDNLDEVPNSKI